MGEIVTGFRDMVPLDDPSTPPLLKFLTNC